MSGAPTGAAQPSKSKRTRTGCLTCRKRHLKCDEAQPVCQNCVKSKKACERGIRLNFLDINVEGGDHLLPRDRDWRIAFIDESKDIASEYEGGSALYPSSDQEPTLAQNNHVARHPSQQDPNLHHGAQYISQPYQPPPPGFAPMDQTPSVQAPGPTSMNYIQPPPAPDMQQQQQQQQQIHQNVHNPAYVDTHRGPPEVYRSRDPYAHSAPTSAINPPHQSPHNNQPSQHAMHSYEFNDLDEKREQLKDAHEVLYMQVFCEEVGIWMDSMDSMKHFSRLLPFHSLAEPMLRNAFLACGARHLTLVNPIYTEERALLHYDTATRHLLKNLQDPDRDTVVCATTAVILNVYEIMCERALPRMNHIAGARALIKECGWDARAVGVGAACFWLNVGLEVLSCLHFKWQAAWDPDDWAIDMDWSREVHNGREEIWTHRMLYIVAKVSNFRATVPKKELPDPNEERTRKQTRYKEWRDLNELADSWNNRIPRTMHPMAYIFPEHTSSKSAFPEVWLIKRTTIVARLFYHTVMVLLAQTNPLQARSAPEMWEMERTHAHMICGITAHVKDRGVASVALRSLAHAGECLTERREQQEVLDIFTKINRETGWRIAFVFKELKALWGWRDDPNIPSPHITSNSDPTPRPVAVETKPHAFNMQPGWVNSLESTSPHSPHSSNMNPSHHHHRPSQQGFGAAVTTPTMGVSPTTTARPRMPSGIKNPLFANADFSMAQHPYQNVWVAPNVLPPPSQQAQAQPYPRTYDANLGLGY